MSIAQESLWYRESDPPPPADAPPAVIAEHLLDLEACGPFAGNGPIYPLTMAQAKWLCEEGGYNWKKTSRHFVPCPRSEPQPILWSCRTHY